MAENGREMVHSFFSRARDGIEIEGVCDVTTFDEEGVSLDTSCGRMAVEGENLHVTVLNITDGRVVIEGRINGTSARIDMLEKTYYPLYITVMARLGFKF